MALADYRLCDVCQRKTFYDSNLDYDFDRYPEMGLSEVGDWKVICPTCATTHAIIVVAKKGVPHGEA